MGEFWKLFNNTDQLLILGSVILIFLGIVAPKKFVGIEVDWTPAKSAVILMIGLALLAFSIGRSVWPHRGDLYDTFSFDTKSRVTPKPTWCDKQGCYYDDVPSKAPDFGGADVSPNKQAPDSNKNFSTDYYDTATPSKKSKNSN